MIPAVPQPDWGDLFCMTGPGRHGPQDLAAAWKADGETAFWLSRSAWALAALAEAVGEQARIWLPGYFCNQSTAALRRTASRIGFYPVCPDLSPDWPACDRLAGSGRPDMFVLVHYFGQPNDLEGARRFCSATGALLIEDAAHVLKPEGGIGGAGDAVFYSPYKLLAVPDGGLLLVRGEALAAAVGGRLDRLAGGTPSWHAWWLKRVVQKSPLGPALTRFRGGGQTRFADDPAWVDIAPAPRPSALAMRLMERQAQHLDSVADVRRANGARLENALSRLTGWQPLFPGCGERPAPYRLVMRCDDAETAGRRFDFLRSLGWPVESWPDLPAEVMDDPASHDTAMELRRTLLCVPVHQSLDVDGMLAALDRATDQ